MSTYPREVVGSWIGTQSRSVLQRRDRCHVALAQLEVEHVEVAHNPLGGHRLGDDDITELDMPPNQYLRGGFPMSVGDGGDRWVLQQRPLRQWAPRLGGDTQLSVHFAQLPLRQQRMQLDLVDGRNDAGGVDQDPQMFRLEVAHPDRRDPPLVVQVCERLERCRRTCSWPASASGSGKGRGDRSRAARRLASNAASVLSYPWSAFHSFVTRKMSSRGIPDSAIARPVSTSLP